MTTTYYVVPAGQFFCSIFTDFPNRGMADRWIAERKAGGDDEDYGVYEVKLVAGVGKALWGDQAHVRDGRCIIVGQHYLGGFVAHDDSYGEEAASLYGYGKTLEAAIAECLENIAIAEERRAISATEKMEA